MNVPILDGLTDCRSLSIASIYRIAAGIMIIESTTLDVFAAISGHWHVPSRAWERMPSWVPDWSRERGSIPFYWPTKGTAFNAAKGYEHNSKDQEKLQVLRVRGKKVDSNKSTLQHKFEDLHNEVDLKKYLRLESTCEIWGSHAERMGSPLKVSTREEKKQCVRHACSIDYFSLFIFHLYDRQLPLA
ncbi:hypothetical protein OEA41_008336 [Lepraria neglecta]|uniref:Uncharacterized protein n=1 Tax=Lepraria neglecta TaxID=209136 RepID=A0AAD9ZH91_9LECA|nr:hypothetical protein OEA41_008336 [Lepraria neglecta]